VGSQRGRDVWIEDGVEEEEEEEEEEEWWWWWW